MFNEVIIFVTRKYMERSEGVMFMIFAIRVFCFLPTAPIADFLMSSSATIISQGQSVKLTDLSSTFKSLNYEANYNCVASTFYLNI